MRSKLFLFTAFYAFFGYTGSFAADRQMQLTSPDSRLKVQVAVGKEVTYSVSFQNKPVLLPSAISITLQKLTLGKGSKVKKTVSRTTGDFNELTISFEDSFSLLFRAYNEGVAYRFITSFEGNVQVIDEQADFNLAGTPSAILQQTDSYTAWEGPYVKFSSTDSIAEGIRATTPALFNHADHQVKIVIAEADVWDYPGMYIQKKEGKFTGNWAKYPAKTEMGSWGNFVSVVKERADFLADAKRKKIYPWRIVIVADEDKDLLNNHLIAKLAQPSLIKDTKWIKPGKAAWEWWHDAILPGAAIPSGMSNRNTALYNYYVDFAAEYHLEYMMIDAGWSNNYDVTKVNPKLDIREVIRRAKDKQVGVFLWCVASTIIKGCERECGRISASNHYSKLKSKNGTEAGFRRWCGNLYSSLNASGVYGSKIHLLEIIIY